MIEAQNLKKKKQENVELLFLYKKLLDLEESCFTKCLRFQKTDFFVNFQQKYSVPRIINLRLDDFIYLLLLAILLVIFGVLPIDDTNSYTTPYRQSLALFFIASFIAMISPHWFRWLSLVMFCIAFPALLYVTINGYINMMPLNTGENIFNYLGYLSLVPIFVLMLLIYPMKEFIRNSIGAIYSYVYGLAITLILYLWPFYSFIKEISSSGGLTFAFITQNKALIIVFIILVVSGFYFFIHRVLFQPKLERIKQILLDDFTEGELTDILQQIDEINFGETSMLHKNFHCFVRSMSFFIYLSTVGIQIFLYVKIAADTTYIVRLSLIMAYVIIFLLFGAFYIYIRVRPSIIMPIIAMLSLGTAIPSLIYYNASFNFYEYAFMSLSGPFAAVFWSIIKNISLKTLIFRTNAILALYISIFIPVAILVINTFQFFTTNAQVVTIINYIMVVIIFGAVIFALIFFIVTEVRKHKIEKDEEKARVPVDYTYHQEGDPEYIPYQISQEYGVGYLTVIDLRDIGYVAGVIFFIFSEVLSIHAVNLLRVDFANTIFYSQSIREIIYASFAIVFMFYIYSHCYLAVEDGEYLRYFFFVGFLVISLGTLIAGFIVTSGSTALKVVGGFSVVMMFVLVALQVIKVIAAKIFGFVSSIIVCALWIFIIIPYVEIIPFTSLYADQTDFGIFIYICILGSIILLIFLVGVLTLVFNRLIDKYQQEKKYKFVMEDVITYFQEEGIETRDDQLHILYESYMFRDKKYVFFLKRGYPLNLLKDPKDNVTKLVTSGVYALERIPTEKLFDEEEQKKRSLLWACLTCCCGEDDEEITQKITKAKKLMDKEELQSLLPKGKNSGLIKDERENIIEKKKKKWKNPAKVYSSKSLILKDLHEGPRYLGDQYILLKTNKNADLAIEIYHNIFDFTSNDDQGESMIIANDFQMLIQRSNIPVSQSDSDKIFYDCAARKWGMHNGMDLQNFALAIQNLAAKVYEDSGEESKFSLLIQVMFYNLAQYEEFNSFMIEKKTKKRVSRNQIKNSPFQKSYRKYKQFIKQKNEEGGQYVKRVNKFNSKKLIEDEPKKIKKEKEEEVVEKGPSCKKIIYDKVVACQTCCKKDEEDHDFQRKLFVRPWPVVSVEAVKIMQKRENDWQNVVEATEHPFRFTWNNFIMAGVKLVDVFTYVSITILNPHTGWISDLSTNNVYLNYSVQLFIAVGVVGISVPFGIRGIMLIFEDRLGLTENRLVATFPHPMFFFVIFYKLIILALFNIVSQTFLSTFNCNWTQSQPYNLIEDTSIECFSSYHNWMVLISLVCILAYYPLSSYAMPNFQFAEKSLDLKFRPSYLILYFQVNFILLAGKVLLSGIGNRVIQIVLNSINISVLFFLGLSVLYMKPCFILWFNWVELTAISIGIIANIMGLVLYMTGQRTLAIILTCSLCGIIILIVVVLIIKRYFSRQVDDDKKANEEQTKELQMMWKSKQKKEKFLISFEDVEGKKQRRKAFNNIEIRQDSDEQNTQEMLFPQ